MRLAWADVARGGAMIFVVLAHVLQLMGVYGWTNGWLDTANLFLTAVRMPLFFLVAGIFGARAIGRSWRGLWSSRLALLVYMYALWSVLRALWFLVVPWPLAEVPPWMALLLAPFWPTNGLWFLYALVLYLVVGRATVRAPAWLVLGAAALLALIAAADILPTGGNGVWKSVAMYLLFFLLGARLPELWRAVAARASLAWLVVAVIALPVSFVAFTLLPAVLRAPGRLVLSVLCVAACLVIAAMVARAGPLGRPLRYIGQRTIAVYVSHAMLLAVVVPLVPAGVVPPVLAAAVFTAVGVGVPLVLYRLLAPVSGVFTLPKPWAARLDRSSERSGA